MGGGDAQGAHLAVAEVLARPVQVLGIQQQALHPGQHPLARRREAGQALARAHEDLHAQLVFQLADLAADAGLGGVQASATSVRLKPRRAASRTDRSC
jgi:hypothetical protein